jgi:outer membrane biosynthesis protein TonB
MGQRAFERAFDVRARDAEEVTDEARALLIVAALLSGASSTAGFVGGRMSVEAPPAEVRLVRMPPRIVRMLPPEAVPVEPVPEALAPPASVEAAPAIAEPPVSAPPVVQATPLPLPRPKVEQPKPQPKAQPKPQPKAPPKPEKEAAAKKPRPPAHKALPSCAFIKREYEALSYAERMASYYRASAEEIAHGKRCLGF